MALDPNDPTYPAFIQLGRWLDAAFTDVRVNSVRHLVVPSPGEAPFMAGVDETRLGLIVDIHLPFLRCTSAGPTLHEILALNFDLTPLGHVRMVPEAESNTCVLELRQQFLFGDCSQERLVFLAERLRHECRVMIAQLQPALGGEPILGG